MEYICGTIPERLDRRMSSYLGQSETASRSWSPYPTAVGLEPRFRSGAISEYQDVWALDEEIAALEAQLAELESVEPIAAPASDIARRERSDTIAALTAQLQGLLNQKKTITQPAGEGIKGSTIAIAGVGLAAIVGLALFAGR